jgi:hypothetical protein
MRKSSGSLKLEMRNDIIRVVRGKMDIGEFLQKAHAMRLSCWLSDLFLTFDEIKPFLEEHNFPKDHMEDMQELWEAPIVVSSRL